MRNKRLCLSGAKDQQHEEKDGEEGKDGTHPGTVALSSSERCPICLNSLSLEVGFPEDCCHAFCISCILKWSETSTSCPVDRKPFQTVYKIHPVFGCTKIHVMARRQKENCSCNLCQWCCTKGKMYYRMHVIKKSANEISNICAKDGCKDDEIPEFQNPSCSSPCLTEDFVGASIFDPTELNHVNSAEIEEESALCLIQRKRQGLNHLRLPTTLERIDSNSSLSVETLIHSPSFLDDYISAIRPLSVRNKGFSKRTCVHSCAQEGTEKKQAAGSKGTRKKNVQSSTRRRSTRNSKSDVSQLQSSPKSSNSDNDAPGCNSSSTNSQSTEHSSKPPPKQRKRTPKKAPRTRKRLRSATQTQREADESKGDSNSESEQDEKKLKLPDDLSASMQLEEISPSESTTEKIYQPEDDHSSVSSPMNQSTEPIPASPPMENMESFVKETSASPESQNEYPFDKENSPPPSPIFTNGQTTAEKSQQESTFGSELGSELVEAAQHLSTEEGDSLQEENQGENVSEEECPGSPLSEKCTEVYLNKDSASSDSSENEMEDHEKHTISSALSEDISHSKEQDYSDGCQTGVLSPESMNASKSSNSSPSKDEHCSDLEDETESSKAEECTSSPAVDSEKQSHLEHSPSSCDSFKENPPETPDLPKVPTVDSPVQDSSFKSDDDLGDDEQVNGVDNGSQDPKLADTETNIPESMHRSTTDSSDCSLNRTELSEQSTTEELCDVGKVKDELCKDDLQNIPLVEKTEQTPEVSSVVASSNVSDDTDNEKESDFKPEEQVTYSEDNNESVAMECDSVSSDREPDQPTKLTETAEAEPGSSASTKIEELESTKEQSMQLEETPKKETRPRRSRFHSPSTTWSPTKSEVKERQKSRSRSRSKNRDSPVKHKSRSRSRDRDRNHSEQWKGRSRDRRHRRQSRSKSRSRSRSGSRNRNWNKSNTAEKSEKDSPWRERRSSDNWKSPRGNDRYRRNEHEKPSEPFRSDKYDSRESSEQYVDNRNDQPDWVSERIKSFDGRGRGDSWMRGDSRGRGWVDNRGRGRGENRGRGDYRGRGDFRGRGDHRGRGGDRGRGGNRGRGSPRGSHWEDNQYNSGDSWNRNVNMDWNSPRGHGPRGRGGFRGGFNYGDQNENSWNNRQPFSGNSNTLGQESTRVQEHKNYKPKYEETYESPVDRSGWTSASSWAVRKTLPADVQNYYSKRGRNSTGTQQGWTRPEASQDQADQAVKDQPSQPTESAQMPVNIVQPPMNVVQQPMSAPPPPPQPVNIYPYSVGVHPPLVSMQHNPYSIHPPPLPIHLHPALPIVQVPAPSSVPQGLPPPPPPPPPSQQVGYVAPPPEAKPLQANPNVSHVSNNSAAPPMPAPSVAQGGVVGTTVAPSSASVAASSHSKNPYVSVKPSLWKETITVEASADSSKKEKKFQIQERAAQEVKGAIKPYYQNKDITKDEYKEIVKKAVDKVCHSKSGEVDSAKVANLVKAYVDKYKHSRKKGSDDKF